VDGSGEELSGEERRFPTLSSLHIEAWSEVSALHLEEIVRSCREYFQENPYSQWFGRLNKVISLTNSSYYGGIFRACHLDLIPYATSCKWNELKARQRSKLFEVSKDTLGRLLRGTPVRLLVLNGTSVVEKFSEIVDINLKEERKPEWALPRKNSSDVMGYAYTGEVCTVSGISLGHRVCVVGFNHNIQGSFGVTQEVTQSIREWIGKLSQEVLKE
jgi:hypothetical protein